MKIIIRNEDDNFTSSLEKSLQELLQENDLKKVHAFLRKDYKKVLTSPRPLIVISKLLNSLDERLEKLLPQYTTLIINSDATFHTKQEQVLALEQEIHWILKVFTVILHEQGGIELFNSLERIIDILPLAGDLRLVKKALDILGLCLSSSRVNKENVLKIKDKFPRLVHNVSMIALHVNLYNQDTRTLLELLSDDPKFKEFNTREGDKLRVMNYQDSFEFEYYIPNLLKQPITEENTNDNIRINIESLKTHFPHESHYSACQKLVQEKRLNIEEASPIFDALLFRIRLAHNFNDYHKRISIIQSALSAFSALDAIRKQTGTFKKYESYTYQNKDMSAYLEEATDLFHLQVTPATHKRVIKMLLSVVSNDANFKYVTFFTSKFSHTGELHLALKDLTSLELKISEKEGATETEKASLNVRSLILPKETVFKSSVLHEVLRLILRVLERYYYDDRRRSLSPDVESLNHLVSSIMNILHSSAAVPNFFLYSKKNILLTLRIVKMLIFHKDFVREFNIIENLVQFGENLFRMLIEEKKCFYQKNSHWELVEKDDLIQTLSDSLNILAYYFTPSGRHTSRAEMAPTVARKVADSGIIKSAVNYLEESNKEVSSDLFREILKIVSEICRESQTLVPRLIDMGVIEVIFKRIKETFHESDDISEMIGLISNVCLQDIGRDLERKYQILELFFDAFTEEKYNALNEKWLKPENKSGNLRGLIRLDKVERELIYITKYVNGYSTIVTTGINKIANFLIDQGQSKVKEFGILSAKEQPEEEKKKALETAKQDFSHYVHKLHNFLEIYSRYLREPRIRGPLFKEGGFQTLMQLISIHQIFFPEYQLTEGRSMDYFYGIIEKELEDPAAGLLGNMEKTLEAELDKIEKITGPLKKLEDFSNLLDMGFLKTLAKKSVLEGLIQSKEKSLDILFFMRSIGLISLVLQTFVNFKLGSPALAERLFALYGAYLRTNLKYNLFQVSNLFKEEEDQEESKEQSAVETDKATKLRRNIDKIINNKKDILNKGQAFLTRIKSFLDQCVYFDMTNPKNLNANPFAITALQIISEIKDLKEIPSDVEGKITFVLQMHLVLNALTQVIYNSTPKLPNHFQTSSASFIFILYEEGALDILAEKIYLMIKLAVEEFDKNDTTIVDSSQKDRQALLTKSLGECTEKVNFVYDKFFFPTLELSIPAVLQQKQVKGVELVEYVNCLLLNHVKVTQELFELVSEACRKLNIHKYAIKEKKPEESKEAKEEVVAEGENKDNKEDKKEEDKKEKEKEKKLEEQVSVYKTALKHFVDHYFTNFGRALVIRQATASKVVVEEKKDAGAEKIITGLTDMGYNRKVAEAATKRIQYMNISLALDWILSHPNEVEKIEKEAQNAPTNTQENKPSNDQPILGALKMERIPNEQYLQTITTSLQELSDKIISNLFAFEGYERGIVKFIRKGIEFNEKNNKKDYARRISIIALKLFKHTVNHYFNKTKYFSSFKVPKTFGKELGQDLLKSYSASKGTPSTKLRNLELSLLWFTKLKTFIPNFERNFLRSDFLTELMNFYEAVILNTEEILATGDQSDPETKQTFDHLKKVNQYMLHIFYMVSNLRQNLEPESSEKKTDKSLSEDTDKKNTSFRESSKGEKKTDKSLSEDTEKKSASLRDSKGFRKNSFRTKKTPLEVLVNIVAVSNNIYTKNKGLALFEGDSVQNLLELLSIFLSESQENTRHFLKLNGLTEILKVRAETADPSQFLNDLSVLFINLIEEPNLVLATIEARVKTFMSQRSKQGTDIPMIEFIRQFQNLYPRHQKLVVEAIQKICIIYAKEPDPIKEKPKKEKKKRKTTDKSKSPETGAPKSPEKKDLKSVFLSSTAAVTKMTDAEKAQRRFIKLKDTAEIGKIECSKRPTTADKKKNKSTEEVDLTEPQPSLPFTPSQGVSQVLNVLIENIVSSFDTKISQYAQQDKSITPIDNKEIFPYSSLIQVLALLCHEHPLLVPYVLNFNCAGLIAKDKELALPLFKRLAERSNLSFLSYYLRVINYTALDKLRYFLVGLASARDVLIQKPEGGELAYLGEEVSREIIAELKSILQSELSRADFLETPDSIQSFSSVGFLLIALLPIRQVLKIIMEKDSEDKREPALLRLYVEALKRLRLKNYYKLENVLPYIIEPCSALLQFSNFIVLNQVDLSNPEKYMPNNILAKHNFREMWEQLLTNQLNPAERQQDLNLDRNRLVPGGVNEDPFVRNFFTRILEMEDEVEDIEIDEPRGAWRPDSLFGAGGRLGAPQVQRQNIRVREEDSSDEDAEGMQMPELEGGVYEWQEEEEQSLESDEEEAQDEDDDDDEEDEEVNGDEDVEEEEEPEEYQEVVVHLQQREGEGDSAEFELSIDRPLGAERRVLGEQNVEEEDEGDFDEGMNEKSDLIGGRRDAKKKLSFANDMIQILDEGIIRDNDLKNVNNLFVSLFYKFEEPSLQSLTLNNPSEYVKAGAKAAAAQTTPSEANIYTRIYNSLLSATAQPGLINQSNFADIIQADRDRLTLRVNDDLRREALLRLLEEGLNEGWAPGNLTQHLLRRVANVAYPGDDQRLFGSSNNRAAPQRAAQVQANAEEINTFTSELLNTVSEDVPRPRAASASENIIAQEVEEESEEESEEEEEQEEQPQAVRRSSRSQSPNRSNPQPSAPSNNNNTEAFADQIASIFRNLTQGVQPSNGNNAPVSVDININLNPQAQPSEQQQAQPSVNTEAVQGEGQQQQAAEERKEEEPAPPVQQEEPQQVVEGEGESTFRLSDFGIDAAFLETYGIDMSVFEMLPDEEKLELVLQLTEAAGIEPNANPHPSDNNQNQPVAAEPQNQNQAQPQPQPQGEAQPEAQAQVQPQEEESKEQQQAQPSANTEQAQGQPATGSQPQATGNQRVIPDIDPEILANLDSFPEDLRNDILQQQNQLLQQNLLAGDPGAMAGGMAGGMGDMDVATFLETLDPALRQEILITSDQNFIDALPSHLAAEAQMIRDNRLNRFDIGDLQAQRNDSLEPPLNFIEKTIKREKKEEALDLQKREKLFESDEKLIESLLKLLYLEPSKFNHFPFELLSALAQQPRNEFLIFDTLMFLLKNTSLEVKQEDGETFPPRAIYEKNRIIKDKDAIYKQVSPHILFIIHCLTQSRSDYFVQEREKQDDEALLEMAPPLQRNTSLGSIRNLRAEMQIKESHPLYDLLQLCSSDTLIQNTANVTLLASIIENICKNPKIFKTIIDDEEQDEEAEKPKEGGEEEEEKKEAQAEKKKAEKKKKEDKEEIYLCKYKLDEQSVMSFCKLLYSDNLNNAIISKLSFIIGVFCQEKHNLDLFIKVMKEILYKVSLESNRFLQQKLVELKNMGNQGVEQYDEQMQNKLKSLLNEVVTKFGNQVLILRIAKIIRFLYENTVKYLKAKQKYESSRNKGKDKEEKPQRKGSLKDELFVKAREEIIKSLETIMLDDNLKAFWINVSECVHLINDKLSKSWDVQNLLNINVRPIIESFFIIHKILNDEEYTEVAKAAVPGKPANKAAIAQVVTGDEDADTVELSLAPKLGRGFSEMRDRKLDPNEIFAFICEKNKKVINNMIKQDYNLLNDSMSMIAKKVPKILDFEIRRAYFRKELGKMQRSGGIRLRIKRSRLMENSFNQLYSRNADELRRKLQIEFVDEEGMDAGGVAREWFLELSKQVFNANYNLFIPSANGNTFQPSLISDPANLNYFRFIGKFIAKALFDKQLLECYFTRSFYKHILGQPINYHDIEDVDPDYYKSLKWILENDISSAGLDLTFSYEFDKFGQFVTEDLVPNGRNIPVTEENKKEYVHLICNHKMARGIKAQIENFLSGFFELIPKSLIAIFDSKELELLISGLPDIDIVDLKENTEYHGFDANSQVIRWFWEILEDMDSTQRANLLQFVTGTSKVPLEGFSVLRGISGPQKFQIHKAGNPEALPTGHTCFNQLDLPEYRSKEQLIEKLIIAITEGKEGFGFA